MATFFTKTAFAYAWDKMKVLLQGKQDSLVSGTNLKTVNGLSLLGNGDVSVGFVENPVAGEIVITDANGRTHSSGTDLEQLLFDVEAGKEAFRLYDFNQSISATLPSVTTDVANTSIPNVDIKLTAEMGATWAVAALMKYEVYNGSTRINAMPVCMFSMDGQKTLRLRMMVAGSSSKQMTKIQGAMLLKHR